MAWADKQLVGVLAAAVALGSTQYAIARARMRAADRGAGLQGIGPGAAWITADTAVSMTLLLGTCRLSRLRHWAFSALIVAAADPCVLVVSWSFTDNDKVKQELAFTFSVVLPLTAVWVWCRYQKLREAEPPHRQRPRSAAADSTCSWQLTHGSPELGSCEGCSQPAQYPNQRTFSPIHREAGVLQE